MIDLHCHLLPQMDDGPENLEATLSMSCEAVRQGITHIVCTPHHNARFYNPKDKIIQSVKELQKELDERKIPLILFEGQEVRAHRFLINDIKEEKVLFIDDGNKYLLLEFSCRELPEYTDQLLYDLRTIGIIPIIVHPERNRLFQENPNILLPYLNMGCLAQLTAPSLIGIYGKKVQQLSERLVAHHLVQMVASDAHARTTRDFYLKKAYSLIEKKLGESRIKELDITCKNIINSVVVRAHDYVPIY